MQAAHGFMQWSPSAKDVGAFINIESTGPWGPDVLFQHQGWALNAYARAAPRPRGNSVRVQGRRAGVSSYSSPLFWFSLTIFIAPLLCQVAQDFFELGAIPADTDYRVLRESSDKLRIPGIDVAFLFDGLAYHTKEDTWTRIRPGTLQGMGENVLATAVEFMGILNASNLENEEIRSVFADVGGRFMVVYPFWAARVLHVAPLAFHVAFFGRARQAMSDVLAAVALALVLPGLLGVSRALVSGLPLSWYAAYVDLEIRCHSLAPSRCSRCSTPLASGSRSLLPNRSFAHSLARSLALILRYGSVSEACLIYVPAALAGMLMPLTSMTKRQADATMQAMGLVFSVVAFIFTAAGMTSSYVAASWATAAALGNHFDGRRQSPRFLWAIFVAPCYFGFGIAAITMLHVVEKIGVAGGAGTLSSFR